MATIQENLDLLQSTKSAIKNAIINKGVSVDDSDSFASYADKISEIETGGNIQKIIVGTDITVFQQKIASIDDRFDFSKITKATQFGNSSATTLGNNSVFESYSINTYAGFKSCGSLTSFTSTLPNLTDGSVMFYECYKLSSWNIDLPLLTNGSQMFSGCTSLISFEGDLSKLATGNNMFDYCILLESWNNDLPKLTNGNWMFNSCFKLTSWDIPLPSLTDGSQMFYMCTGLTGFTSDLSSLTSASDMFYNCKNITDFTLTGTLNCDNFKLSDSTNLTVDSLMNVINALVDLTGQSSKTLVLGSTNLAKLTDEQKAVATNKNWVLE